MLVCSWKFANQFAVFNTLCIFLNFQVPIGPAAGHPTGEKNLIAGLFSVYFLWLTERLDIWMLSWLARLWDWLTDWLTCRSTLPADGHSFSRVVTHGSAISTPPTSPSYFLIDWTDGQWSFQRISSESPFKKTIIRWSDLSHPWKRVAKPFIKFWVTLCLTLIYSLHKIWQQPCTTLKARTLPLPLAAERFGW